MTRSGEKLAGDWEARIVANSPLVPWATIARRTAMIVLAVILSVSALFGFG